MKIDYKQITNEVFSKNFWSRLIVVVFSIFLLSINYNTFLLNNELVIGGTSGLAVIAYSCFNIEPSIFIIIVNIILLVLSFFFLGMKSTGLTIIGSFLYPLFISITKTPCSYLYNYLNLDSFLIVAIISGVLYGIANGFIFKTGFSTGGTDIIMQLITKYLKIPNGSSSLITNAIVILTGAYAFGINKAIYAIIIIVINSALVDKIMLGISDSKMFYIHTEKRNDIVKFINEMNYGYTIMKTEGGYSNKDNNIIMCVISTKDYYMFRNVISKIDPQAFFIISDCYEVYGGQRKEKFSIL